MTLELSAGQWAAGLISAFLIGVAKTGVPGVGTLAIPVLILMVGDARQAAAWTLPILCTADMFAVYYWRGHAAAGRLFRMTPWVLVGVGLGTAALSMHERTLRPIVAGIILIMLAIHLRSRLRPPKPASDSYAAPYGIAAGFTTTVANAAGPVMHMFMLRQRLPKDEFMATGAWFFFALNLAKIPVYAWHGLFSARSLRFNLMVLPAIIAGALTGRWAFRYIPQKLFDVMIMILTAVTALLLLR